MLYRIVHYARFVEGLKDAEEAPGCEHCTDNRLLIEHAWQVVANEFFDPAGHFSQAKWADQLLQTFQVCWYICLPSSAFFRFCLCMLPVAQVSVLTKQT